MKLLLKIIAIILVFNFLKSSIFLDSPKNINSIPKNNHQETILNSNNNFNNQQSPDLNININSAMIISALNTSINIARTTLDILSSMLNNFQYNTQNPNDIPLIEQ